MTSESDKQLKQYQDKQRVKTFFILIGVVSIIVLALAYWGSPKSKSVETLTKQEQKDFSDWQNNVTGE